MHAPAPIITQRWNHTVPTEAMQMYDLQLLTITGVSVLGRWCGELGEFFIGWAPLLNARMVQLIPYNPITLTSNLFEPEHRYYEH